MVFNRYKKKKGRSVRFKNDDREPIETRVTRQKNDEIKSGPERRKKPPILKRQPTGKPFGNHMCSSTMSGG